MFFPSHDFIIGVKTIFGLRSKLNIFSCRCSHFILITSWSHIFRIGEQKRKLLWGSELIALAIKRGSFFLRCWFHFMDNYMYFITWAELIGFGYYMLYLMMHPTHYSITWFHTTGSLSRKSRKFFSETSLDMSGENRKWLSHFTRSWYHMISIDQLKTYP